MLATLLATCILVRTSQTPSEQRTNLVASPFWICNDAKEGGGVLAAAKTLRAEVGSVISSYLHALDLRDGDAAPGGVGVAEASGDRQGSSVSAREQAPSALLSAVGSDPLGYEGAPPGVHGRGFLVRRGPSQLRRVRARGLRQARCSRMTLEAAVDCGVDSNDATFITSSPRMLSPLEGSSFSCRRRPRSSSCRRSLPSR